MKKIITLALVGLISLSVSANEYERDTIKCTISGDEQTIEEYSRTLRNKLFFEIKVTSIKDKQKILKKTLGDIKMNASSYSTLYGSKIENEVLSNALEIKSFKKDRYLDIDTYVSRPGDIFDMETRFVVKMKRLNNEAVRALLSELKGEAIPDLRDSNFKNKSLTLSAKTDYDSNMRVQIHFPIDGEYDGLSYHINFSCRK